MPNRRAVLAAACTMLGVASPARAQTAAFPSRPIRLLVGFAPGGATDGAARAVAPRMSELLGQQVVIENRGGAGGNIATEAVVRAAPDGYTILLGTIGPLIVNPVMDRNLPFDPLRDLAPIGTLVEAYGVLVVPAGRPWRTAGELVAEARRRPGALNWGYSGVGTSGHLSGLLLDRVAQIETQGVSYRGGAPLMTDLIAGRLDYAFSTAPTALPNVENGRLRALAVPTPRRVRALPDVPTIAETGVPGYEVFSAYGLLAPQGTPAPVIARLNAAVRGALETPEVVAALARQGLEAQHGSPEEYGDFLRAELVKWEPIIRANNLRSD
ncbi:Bug family tripartite tricarboxylate transporter substrate binding protein [Falsiroseomonas oryzae]|uniref:Bug family tripartite tricarboxylate transporter substrate binding protein n=1 Tax=Falsiroseomonas oryzae TaxID=2766473 RepID=UPI0022EAA40E|nr:tripartite tricarboxylate transporter substrate binding protein [Roseomonas sp. MO-31]